MAIRASDGRYLQSNGQLVECPQSHDAPSNGNGAAGGKGPGPACLFALEVRAAGAQSGIVFRDERGAFLGVSGTRHTLRVGGTPGFGAKGPAPAPAPAPGAARGTQGAGPAPSRDEVFLLERSIAQMALKSCANGKFISSKQGTSRLLATVLLTSHKALLRSIVTPAAESQRPLPLVELRMASNSFWQTLCSMYSTSSI